MCFSQNLWQHSEATVYSHLEGCPVHLEPTIPWWKHIPTICHGLTQDALGQDQAPEHLQNIDETITWGNRAEEVFEKGRRIIQILLKAGFAIKQSKVKGPAQQIHLLGIKWQDGHCHIPIDVINKITAVSPPINKKRNTSFLRCHEFLENTYSRL